MTRGRNAMWIIYALLSAVFAALTTILAKIGVENVDSTLATAIRTAVVLVMAWGMVFLLGKQGGVSAIGACPDWRPAVRGCFTTRPCRWARPAVWLRSTS